MPANIGEMFYYGEIPWHKLGRKVDQPLKLNEATKAAGLDWDVEMIGMHTAENPPSKVRTRFAIVRKDRKAGDPGRVVGVAHPEFKPLQNREGAKIFDEIFGKGSPVYHTGGYLGVGEKVWLMAKLPRDINVGVGDTVMPYALFSNSHDGSIAIDFRITTVRVVCQNTLSLALANTDARAFFKRSHHGDYENLQQEVKGFFEETIRAVDNLGNAFRVMLGIPFSVEQMNELVDNLLPMPKKPTNVRSVSRVLKAYDTRVKSINEARKKIIALRDSGLGTNLAGVRGSLWGGLNAILEFVDHHMKDSETGLALGLFGKRTGVKRRAFEMASLLLP